jgi:hypothetical protein
VGHGTIPASVSGRALRKPQKNLSGQPGVAGLIRTEHLPLETTRSATYYKTICGVVSSSFGTLKCNTTFNTSPAFPTSASLQCFQSRHHRLQTSRHSCVGKVSAPLMAAYGIYHEINQDNRNNGAKVESTATQRLSKHVPAATNREIVGNGVFFFVGSAPRVCLRC